ncbi:glycosyl hydrolase family 43 protein [Diplocarpon mali]|nr:glycosyl hydrolase family 43 protein [Diplocarpon mali]
MHCSRYILCFLFGAAVNAKYIVPGARWRDTNGNLVNAHAGGVTVDKNGTFWWFGEYKIQGQVEGGGVSVYSSTDLATWTSHGLALEPIEGHPYIAPSSIIQRPKVVYSEPLDQYHMWWHADNSTYGLLLQGLAVSKTISGPYSFVNATAPLGNWSQDFGIFTDYKDGRSYSLYSNGDRKEGRDIYLTSFNKELTELEKVVHRFDKFDLEAPTIIQTDKSYYALMSHKTGKTGEWNAIQGKTYYGKDAKVSGTAFKQEANFASGGIIATGVYGNDSSVSFEGIEGSGKPQWVSFYYQNIDDMGFGDQPGGSPDRFGGTWQLRRISSVVVNGDVSTVHTLFQRDTHKGIVLSTPLQLTLGRGNQNTITVRGLSNGFDLKGADLDRIVVYPSEA